MTKHKLKILITRPEKAGRDLQGCLQQQGYQSYCQPCFDYQDGASLEQLRALQRQLTRPLVIFISVAAVEFANKLMPISLWSTKEVIAVGAATEQALKTLGINALVPTKHDSEGLLALQPLQNVQTKDVLIVRGDGGRELIAEDLRRRGASVHYLESYQRVWRNCSPKVIKTWHQQQINCILITSNALLEFIVSLIDNSDNYWQEQCLWIVASNRIALKAEEMGINRVINAHGANTTAIINALAYGQELSHSK
ncbi:uroporphyrinogen-III synthase [Colwellia sp. C1TZA3]|uniref:uroporphyrinogen-III synthase n=1 Tax=Colwellia sp. C1TZA3 TaxID=2508879 RepID=UPI0011B98373|nr:uroporphyrinogen-III synthase [Colwellia sp. C1TZA3]TWX74241.1 uroporphyrinogen-III synthase [Colwellia sp. C1TZA3]